MEINDELRQEILEAKNKHILGDKIVTVKKVTPYEYKLIMKVVNQLPGLLFSAFGQYHFNEDKQNVFITLMTVADLAMDEIIEVTSILTELDKEYIEKKTGLDELVNYLFKLSTLNSIDKAIKNMVSPLQKAAQEAKLQK